MVYIEYDDGSYVYRSKSWLNEADIQFNVCMYQACVSSLSSLQDFEELSFRTKKGSVKDSVQSRIVSEVTTTAKVKNQMLGH